MIPVLKFSHDYSKFPYRWLGTQATLLSVTKVDISAWKLSHPAFIKYDVSIRGGGEYPLGNGDHLVLVFIHGNSGQPFTTIRRWTPEKERYYKSYLLKPFTLDMAEVS